MPDETAQTPAPEVETSSAPKDLRAELFEDFLTRTAARFKLKVKFKFDSRHSAGDFLSCGIQGVIRDRLIKLAPTEEAAIRTNVSRVFGQGGLVNFLSHDNPGRFEVTFDQAKDFVRGVRDLTTRSEEHKLIKGR